MTDEIKCPVCGSETRLRTSKKDGSKFHVCVNYPECNGKVAFDDDWGDDWDYKRPSTKAAHDNTRQQINTKSNHPKHRVLDSLAKNLRNKSVRGIKRGITHPINRLKFSWGFVINILLIGIGLAIIGYTAELLIKGRISTYAAIAVIVVDSLSTIWNIATLRRRFGKVRIVRAVLTILILTLITLTVCAYTGVHPFSDYKDKIGNYFNINSSGSIATKTNIFITEPLWTSGWVIDVELQPTDNAKAGKVYQVDLYEQGKLRATTTVSWNQPEINVKDTKTVEFPASSDEFNAYALKDISHIFSVKVH